MRYVRLKWNHTNPDEPIWIFSELDEDGKEVRKIECFQNGFCDIATATRSLGTTRLNTEPLPELAEIAKDPEFEPVEITKEEFEEVWRNRRFKLT